MVDKPAYLAKQSEERTHNILMGSADYTIGFNDNKNSISFFMADKKPIERITPVLIQMIPKN